MRLLNLFSGTDSVATPWREAGHEVISVDIDPRYNPEICEDILQLSYCKLPIPDVIWASPPCDQYARCRTRAKTPRNLALADSLVAKAIKIIQCFQKLNPDLIWFIENGESWLEPMAEFRNMILKMREDRVNHRVKDESRIGGYGPFKPESRQLILKELFQVEKV